MGGRFIGKNSINWEKSIGYKVPFIYDDIRGELPILDIIRKKCAYVVTEYSDNKNFHIATGNLSKCALGELLNKINHEYKYSVGEIIESVNSGKLQILEQIKMTKNRKYIEKYYKYKCLICGNIDNIYEYHLNGKRGCNVCSNNKILKGYNDLWTTHPKIAEMLKDPEEGYQITFGTNIKQIYICPNCGYEKNIAISTLLRCGLACPKCSDGISYSEKIMFSVLEQLNLIITTQLNKTTFDWCKEYKYDFYIPSINCIIETHGKQHYEEKAESSNFKRTLYEEQENDRIKKELSIKNGIKEENYIVIDCRKSELEFIKNKILNSKLNNQYDLSDINWLKCHEYACSSFVKKACDLWSKGIKSTSEISEVLKLDRHTICNYLKQGSKIGLCKYDSKEVAKNNLIYMSENNYKKIVCLTNGEIFCSLKEACIKYNTSSCGISNCCGGRVKSSGIHPETGEKLIWMYHEKFITKNESQIKKIINSLQHKKVICLTTGDVFNSKVEAGEKYNMKNSGHIADCCSNKRKSCGKHTTTGEKLKWMYYDDYLKLQEESIS